MLNQDAAEVRGCTESPGLKKNQHKLLNMQVHANYQFFVETSNI